MNFILAIEGKRRAINIEIRAIASNIDSVNHHAVLDHALATLTQLSRSIETNLNSAADVEKIEADFEIKDLFAPAQKNEKQLFFKRTSDSAGRKKGMQLL